MLFSILIPTCNNEGTIKKAVMSSLLQEEVEDFEVIVVNNASDDKTLAEIESINDSHLKIFTNEHRVSMFENHDICLNHANGDYVVFCHSDDSLLPNTLKILKHRLEYRGYPSKYILWGRSMYMDYSSVVSNASTLKKLDFHTNEVFSGSNALELLMCSGLTPSGTCYSRESLIKLGGFHNIHGSWENDWFVVLYACLNQFEFEMMDRLIFIREFASTASKKMKFRERMKISDNMFKYLFSHLSNRQLQQIVSVYKSNTYIYLYPYFRKHLSFSERFKYYIKVLSKRPSYYKYLTYAARFKNE